MWDDFVFICTITPATPTHTIEQRECCPGRVCRSAERDTHNAEVCHRAEIFYFLFLRQHKKGGKENIKIMGGGGRRRKGIEDFSPASEVPTSPQPVSPKFKSTLCFSALKTPLLDIASGDGVMMCWIWPCPGAETDVDDGGGEAAGMNSMRSQRFCLREFNSRREEYCRTG